MNAATYEATLGELTRQLQELDTELDAVLAAARRSGLPWTRIGPAMGMTPEGASQRARRRGLPCAAPAERT